MVNHNAQNETLEITMDIFTDDLEFALQEGKGELMRLGDEREHVDADHLIEEYIAQHFDLWIDGRKLELLFLGKDVQHDLTYCFLEIGNIQDFHTMRFKHDLLCEMYVDQRNFVEINFGGWNEQLVLTGYNPVQEIAH